MRLVAALAGAAALAVLATGCADEPDGVEQASGAQTSTVAASAPQAPPLTSESLPAIALSLADLPSGFAVDQEGYVQPGANGVTAFRRTFQPGETRLGSSVVAQLSSDVALFQSSDAATTGLASILAALGGADVKERFAEIVRAMGGLEATAIDGQTLASPTLGDGTVLARATFETSGEAAELFFVTVRVGQLHGVVFVLGPAGGLALEDVIPLVQILVARLETAAAGELRA